MGSVSTFGTGELFDNRYLLMEQLGTGTSGEVWRARDQHRDRDVALKVLAGTEEDDAWQEARRLTELESPNILRVNNADVAIDVPYIDSVLASGGTAEDEMTPLGMSPALAVHLTRGALRGLQLCHDRRVLHRDVKPANIFISATGDAQLGDFGCAGLMAPDGTAKPHGDPDIRPLDVLKGIPCSTSSDVYGAGISLYAMLTGSLPFSISDAGDFMTHRANVAAGMPDIRDVAPHVGIGLAKVIRKATQPMAKDRYATSAQFSTDLARHVAGQADICRIEGVAAEHLNHDGHETCWLVRRRRDGVAIYVCTELDGRSWNVDVRRSNGNRLRPECKSGTGKNPLLVHLRKVFAGLR